MEAERHTAHLEEVGWVGWGVRGRPLMFMGGLLGAVSADGGG